MSEGGGCSHPHHYTNYMHRVASVAGRLCVNTRSVASKPYTSSVRTTPTRLLHQLYPPRYPLHLPLLYAITPNRDHCHVALADSRQTAERTFSSRTNMEPNGHTRHKRKGSPVNTYDRPTKLSRPRRSDTMNSDHSTDGQYINGDSMAEPVMESVTATADTAEWQDTIERVVRNVVSIHFCQTCSFDTSAALSSEATGFVVDAKRGYILTNRHVVGSGPFWGYCIFDNHEEVSGRFEADCLKLY